MRLTRRRLAQLAAFGANAAFLGKNQVSGLQQNSQSANQDGLTRRAAEFIVQTKYADLPRELLELGKKSILDGIGLALVGSAKAALGHFNAHVPEIVGDLAR